MAGKPATVDEYVAALPAETQLVLQDLRARIRRVVPDAEESISYDMLAFRRDGTSFAYVAAWKKHISVYPVPDSNDALNQRIAPYRAGKGTLQFPLTQPIPYELIEEVIELLAGQRQ